MHRQHLFSRVGGLRGGFIPFRRGQHLLERTHHHLIEAAKKVVHGMGIPPRKSASSLGVLGGRMLEGGKMASSSSVMKKVMPKTRYLGLR